jgi:sulfur carrier protein ThiS
LVQINLCAFGNLRRYTPDRQERMSLEVQEGTTVRSLLDEVGVPWNEVGFVVVNGTVVDQQRALAAGDKVEAFSPIGGGSEAQ